MIIEIHWSETNGGYNFEVYKDEGAMENGDSLSGGVCTGTEFDAVDMACDEASGVLLQHKSKEGEIHPYMA